jgi:hypothetical protein
MNQFVFAANKVEAIDESIVKEFTFPVLKGAGRASV